MKQIFFDIGTENLLFVRYNPDEYNPLSGKKMTSQDRQTYLLKFLQESMKKLNFKNLGVIYLFYDGFITSAIIK